MATGNCPDSVAIGDLNGDGQPDLAVAYQSDSTVSVFVKDTGDSNYSTTTLPTDAGPVSLAIGDFSNDGKLDIATANTFASTVTLLQNTTPQASKTSAPAGSPGASAVGQPVTFTSNVAEVTSLPGAPAPTGTLTFSVDGAAQAPVGVTAGAASFLTSSLTVGPHTISAAYSGDANYAPSVSASATYTVGGTITGTVKTRAAPAWRTSVSIPTTPSRPIARPIPRPAPTPPGSTR